MLTDFDQIAGKTLPDCLRILTGLWGGGFRIFYGFFPDCEEEASGLLTNFYRILVRRLTDLGLGKSGCWNLEATALLIVYELGLSKKLTWATLG